MKLTPEAIDIIENKFPDGTFVYTNSEQTGIRIALTNPTLLKAQGLHTTEEMNAAREQGKREGAELGYTECAFDFLGVDKVSQQEYEEAKETFLSSLPVSSEWVMVGEKLPDFGKLIQIRCITYRNTVKYFIDELTREKEPLEYGQSCYLLKDNVDYIVYGGNFEITQLANEYVTHWQYVKKLSE